MRTDRLRILLACLVLLVASLDALVSPRVTAATSASCDGATPAGSDVVLNEILPLPASDWNGDGSIGPGDAFVELYNRGATPRSVANWSLSTTGATFSFPRGAASTVSPGGFLVVFGSATGTSLLSPTGGDLALLDAAGATVDECRYPAAAPNVSFARLPDGSGAWTTAAPTPGKANAAAPTPTPTATPTATGTPTPSPTATTTSGPSATAAQATATASPTPTSTATDTPTATATPRGVQAGAVINEILVVPAADWNGDGAVNAGDQAIELVGTGAGPTSLSGWQIATDAGQRFVLPRGFAVPPGGMRALYGSQTGIALNPAGGDVELLDAAGNLVDRVVYPPMVAGLSWARLPDGVGSWQLLPASPNATNAHAAPSPTPSPQPTPTAIATPTAYAATPVGGAGRHLELSQVLSNPSRYDWDGDGTVSLGDQFITVVNPTSSPTSLAGYQLTDKSGQTFVFPRGITLAAGARLTVFQSQSLLILNPSQDTVTLLAHDGSTLDQAQVGALPPDMALVRSADGSGLWSVSPPIVPPPSLATPTPTAVPTGPQAASAPGPSTSDPTGHVRLALASPRTRAVTHRIRVLHRAPHGTIVTIQGQVTYPSGLLLGQRAMVLQEDGVAALVRAEFDVPPLPLDEVVTVTGRVRQSDEGTEIIALSPDDVAPQGPESPVAPFALSPSSPSDGEGFRPVGEVPTATPDASVPEGILVSLRGVVTERRQRSWRVQAGGDRYGVEGDALGSLEAPLRSAVQAVGIVVYRPASPGNEPRHFAPFSALLRRDGERVVLVRGAADVTFTISTPTPTHTPRPTRGTSEEHRKEPSAWPKVGEGGMVRQ